MKLSVVATLYRSAPYIVEFYERVTAAARKLEGENYEIIFVNDGSPDNGLEMVVELTTQDSHLTVIDLSRNFGHQKAMMTGLSHAKGELVFLIDSDLEECPEWLLDFHEQLVAKNADVVFGVQAIRKGRVLERIGGALFYNFISYLSGYAIPKNSVVARLMKKQYVESLVSFKESNVYIGGLMHLAGYSQVALEIKKGFKGDTTYALIDRVSSALNAISSLSSRPLIYVFKFGLLICLISIVFVFKISADAIFFDRPLAGWSSLIASVWLIGGLIMCAIGIVGYYLSKIFDEVKNRPYTIVRHIYRKDK